MDKINRLRFQPLGVLYKLSDCVSDCRCFAPNTLEGIVEALQTDGSDWAKQQIEVTSIPVTHFYCCVDI